MLRLTAALSISALLLTATAYAAASGFESSELEVQGRIRSVLSHDFDRDGRNDLLIVHTSIEKDGETLKWFTVYWQGDEGFKDSRVQTWEADERAAAVDVGDIYGDPQGEIAFLAGDGVFVYTQDDGIFSKQPILLLEEKSLLGLVPEEDIPEWNFILDLDDDGKDDLIVPQIGRYIIYLRDENGYRRAGSPRIHMSFSLGAESDRQAREDERQDSQVPSLRVSYRGAGLTSADFDGDGVKDLIAVWRDNLNVYLQKSGRFEDEADKRMKMELSSKEERESGISQVSLRLEDMNNDGILDIVGLKSRFRGPTNIQSQVHIFYGRSGADYPAVPDKIVVAEGIAAPILQDLDGNGVIDVIMPQMKFDLATLIRVLTTQSINMGLVIYLGDTQGDYPTQPSQISNLSLEVNPFAPRGGEPIFRMDGDFNGDQRPDMLVGAGDNELSVFWGGGDGSPSPGADLKLKVKKPDQIEISDLNRDGASDIIAIYETEGKMIVLLSGK